MNTLARLTAGRLHYAWIMAGVTFVLLMASAGMRASPGAMVIPLEQTFGWSRASISGALSINLLLYGLAGPFAAALMTRIGIRRTVLIALAFLFVAVVLGSQISQPWHLVVAWGLMIGMGTGALAQILGVMVANRWFVERRGAVMGALSASGASGQLVFIPLIAAIATTYGWQSMMATLAAAAIVLFVLCYFLFAERPSSVGTAPLGAAHDEPPAQTTGNPVAEAFRALGRGSRSSTFWLLSGSFFVCGLTTNGFIGTHLIAACFDQGIPQVTAAGLVAGMGVFNLVGTTLSGWLSDKVDNRMLLFWYYSLRGLSLFYLPFSDFTFYGLSIFAVFYGLDWIATVPPTARLATAQFGKQDGPILYGWIFVIHQLGGATAAWGAGLIRTMTGSYFNAFMLAGVACGVAATLVMLISRPTRPQAQFAPA